MRPKLEKVLGPSGNILQMRNQKIGGNGVLKLGAENKIPASVAKTNIEKAKKSGANGFKSKVKAKNAARAFRRARNTRVCRSMQSNNRN